MAPLPNLYRGGGMSWYEVTLVLLYAIWAAWLFWGWKMMFADFERKQAKQLEEFRDRISSHLDSQAAEALKKMKEERND